MDMLAVKNVKHAKFMSEETLCFTASVYFNGKKVGTAENRGQGGNTMIFPDSGKSDQLTQAEEWAKAQPPQEWEVEWQDEPMIVDTDIEILVDELVAQFLEDRDWKRRLKKKTYFRLEGDEEGSYLVINHPYDERVKAHLNKKYGDSISEIINERFLSKA